MPTQTDGTSAAHMSVSETTTRSQSNLSISRTSRSSKWGLPTSSSPSIRNFRLTGRRPSVASRPRTASSWNMTWPLSSIDPLARSSPSTTTGSNGGECHSSRGSTGWTSWWP